MVYCTVMMTFIDYARTFGEISGIIPAPGIPAHDTGIPAPAHAVIQPSPYKQMQRCILFIGRSSERRRKNCQ